MKINAVNFNINNQCNRQSFKGIIAPDKTALREVIDETELPTYNKVTDEKGLTVWILKNAAVAGGGYTALIQDKNDTSIMKTITCKDSTKDVDNFKNRLELSIVFANAYSNMAASASLRSDEKVFSSNPQFADTMCKKLDEIGMPVAANGWKANFENI